jgi:hypothetical protein
MIGGTLGFRARNPKGSIMKIIALASALAFAAILGWAQPTLAQPAGQPSDSAGTQTQPDATTPTEQPNWHQRWRDQGGAMNPHAGWMGRRAWGSGVGGGAHFRFTRGDARIDIQCPANEDVEHCVKAAGELVDKVMRTKETANSTSGQTASPPATVPAPR